MNWEPFGADELAALIREGLADADDEIVAVWEKMRIPPVKWRCSPWGDEGGGFWVVAIRNGTATYYNDIEEGFNESSFDSEGTLNEYWCNQGDFSDYLGTLSEARVLEAEVVPSLAGEVPVELRLPGTIRRRQTTYWKLGAGGGTSWRVRFRGKLETAFETADFSRVEMFEQHPLLLDYREPWFILYLASGTTDPERAESFLETRVRAASDGWRSLSRYLNRHVDWEKGQGMLARVPETVANELQDALAELGIRASRIDGGSGQFPNSTLVMLGRSYIVAEAINFERLE